MSDLRQMLIRSTREYWEGNPHYEGTQVCDEWFMRSNFHNWMLSQPFWWNYHLDKDLLDPSNKMYSPDKCVLVPQGINSLLTDRRRFRGECPLGVTFDKESGKFMAQCNIGGMKSKNLGRFSSPHDAHRAYQKVKRLEIMRVADDYFTKGLICERTHQALIMRSIILQDHIEKGVETISIHHF